ncbi:MAG: PAS domain S-box protein [Spirochaetales bacterium]|nr:PAS domain S-box protein [Spirochaetales bacterium]MCF7938491.1 PAS domain S-box protein [Spirochaetales bacterium]
MSRRLLYPVLGTLAALGFFLIAEQIKLIPRAETGAGLSFFLVLVFGGFLFLFIVFHKRVIYIKKNFRRIQENLDTPYLLDYLIGEDNSDYRELIEYAGSAILKYNMEARITFFNKFAEELFGFDRSEVIGRLGIETINKPEPGKEKEQRRMLERLIAETESMGFNENWNRRKDGTMLWVSWRNRSIYDKNGKKIGVACIANDNTEQHRAQEIVRKNLREKELLLQEVHHRVKNNMQIISSLLHLQLENIRDPEDRKRFFDAENRIQAMALIHEHLYQDESFATFELQNYINSLLSQLADSYIEDRGTVSVKTHVEDDRLDLNTAIPFGLILNELVSNALKYAFPQGKRGKVAVSYEASHGEGVLTVQDDGIGIPHTEEEDPAHEGTLGIRLVESLARQIGGAVSCNHGEICGTKWVLRFPRKKTGPGERTS